MLNSVASDPTAQAPDSPYPERRTDNVTAAHHLNDASKHASVAYWVGKDERDMEWHRKKAIAAMREAAAIYGFTLVETGAYEDAVAFIDDQRDTVDGDYGAAKPNRACRIYAALTEGDEPLTITPLTPDLKARIIARHEQACAGVAGGR